MHNRKIKIAMFSVHSSPLGRIGTKDNGGMSVYIRELTAKLCLKGHSIDIFTRKIDPRYPEKIKINKNTRLINLNAGPPGKISKASIETFLPQLVDAIEQFRETNGISYDIIHSHYWISGLAGLMLKEKWKIPALISFHTLSKIKNALDPVRKEPLNRIKGEEKIVDKIDRIISPTDREKKELIDFYQADDSKIGIVKAGVNRERFNLINKSAARQRLGLNFNEKIILSAGRFDPIKGYDLLIKAFHRMENRDDFKAVIIGGGDNPPTEELNKLKKIATSLGIEDKVLFPGRVRHSEMPLWLNAADIFVFPSYCESFGLASFESLAAGTPVVGTRVGGLEDIIVEGQNGFLISPGSEEELTYKLVSASNTLWDRQVIRDSTANFTWKNTAKAILKEYMSALK